MNLRKVTSFHNEELEQLTTTVYNNFAYLQHHPELLHSPMKIQRLLSSDHFFGLMMYSESSLIGYLFGETLTLGDGRMVFFINYLYVSHQKRGQGIGKLLLNELKSEVIHRFGFRFITLLVRQTNQPAIQLYLKAGFVVDNLIPPQGPSVGMTCFV